MPGWNTLKKELFAQLIVGLYLFFAVWWIVEQIFFKNNPDFSSTYGFFYGITAGISGIFGLYIARNWGGFSSLMGKSITYFSVGLLMQFFGQASYSLYYYILQIEAPYPSLGDIGFFGTIPFYILAIWYLAKVSGVKIGFKSFGNKLQAIIIPLIVLAIAYFIFLQGYEFDWSQPLVIFLDFAYPLGDALYVSLAILAYLLTRGTLGGIMKNKILFVLFALIIQFTTDFLFLFQVNTGTWIAGGINDFFYLTTYFTMGIALIKLKTVHDLLKSKVE